MTTAQGSASKTRCSWVLLATSLVAAAAAGAGCKKASDDDTSQVGQAIGEAMASMDESAQGSVTAALDRPPMWRTPNELRGPTWRRALDAIVPAAYGATSCWGTTFSACASGTRVRTFDSCAIGPSTLAGSVTLAFNRPALCVVAVEGDSVTRAASFTLTGPYGGTLAVSAPDGGQTWTKTAAGFEYAVGGMERVLMGPGGHTLFDISTRTTSPIEVTGSSRTDLTIVSGAFEITHHLAGYKVTLMPNNLAWSASCNCAVSGSLTGTVSGGRLDGKSATVTLTGCGEATVTIGTVVDDVVLDRCAPI